MFKKKTEKTERKLGCLPSKMDGTEHVFGNGSQTIDMPSSYSYKEYMPKVLDQGSESICVPCSVSAFLNWRENLKDGDVKDNKIDYYELYGIRTNEGEGMTFKEAFRYLRHHGVKSKAGVLKINEYALVRNFMDLKFALIINGPCFGALPVYNDKPEFWNKEYGDGFYGYHAISIVGYNETGFIIRNSWGTGFADKGYTTLKYEDFSKMVEAWTVMS